MARHAADYHPDPRAFLKRLRGARQGDYGAAAQAVLRKLLLAGYVARTVDHRSCMWKMESPFFFFIGGIPETLFSFGFLRLAAGDDLRDCAAKMAPAAFIPSPVDLAIFAWTFWKFMVLA